MTAPTEPEPIEPAPADLQYRKSSYSSPSGNCVEIAHRHGTSYVRDSKDEGAGPVLQFNDDEWDAFVAAAKDGEFDRK